VSTLTLEINSDSRLLRARYYPIVAWGLGTLFFFCHYFARVSPGVMVAPLMRDLSVPASAIGGLSACFYYAYVGMQIPAGLLVDRYSLRVLLTLMTLLAGFGCALFASADSLLQADLGRFCLGFGSAFSFVGALKLATEWFSVSRVGLLVGLTQAIGIMGAFVGALPVAYLTQLVGWRATLFGMAGIFVVLACLIGLLVRDHPKDVVVAPTHQPKLNSIWARLSVVLSNRQTWFNASYAGFSFAPTAVFAELWGVSYLQHVYGMSANMAAFANGLIFIGWGLGGPLMGGLSDRMGRRKPLMKFSASVCFVCLAVLFYVPNLPIACVFSALLIFGVFNAGVAISYTVSSEINPHYVSGTTMGFTNMMSVLIGALLQPVVGVLLDWHHQGLIDPSVPIYSASDYQVACSLLPLCPLLALSALSGLKETYCRSVETG